MDEIRLQTAQTNPATPDSLLSTITLNPLPATPPPAPSKLRSVPDSSASVVSLTERRAKKILQDGLQKFYEGEVELAAQIFKQSLEVQETADGFTYLAWMVSFGGHLDLAIQLCQKAIEKDPEFGNPYNDIGTYLMKKGELDNAIPWLERAKQCLRYENRHFPYVNLGRIYLSRGMFLKALDQFEVALNMAPNDGELRTVVVHLRKNYRK